MSGISSSGMTSEGAVKLWYDEHSPNEIDKETYQQIYTATQPILSGKDAAAPKLEAVSPERLPQYVL